MERTKEETVQLVKEKGFKCRECKHPHTGARFAYICIGCVCDFVPDFEAILEEWPEVIEEP